MNFVQEQLKKTENQCQNDACEQKATSEKTNCCSNTEKISRRKTTRSSSCFGVTKTTTLI